MQTELTLTARQVIQALEAVRGVDRENELRPRVSLKLGRVERKLLAEAVEIEKIQQKIGADHREETGDQVKTVGLTELEEELTELMESQITLKVETLTLSQLEKATGKKKDLKAKGTWLAVLEEVGILIVEESDAEADSDTDDE